MYAYNLYKSHISKSSSEKIGGGNILNRQSSPNQEDICHVIVDANEDPNLKLLQIPEGQTGLDKHITSFYGGKKGVHSYRVKKITKKCITRRPNKKIPQNKTKKRKREVKMSIKRRGGKSGPVIHIHKSH